MSDEQALAQVREFKEVISQLKNARGNVRGFRLDDYEDAGGAQWAGQKRTSFTAALDMPRLDYAQNSEQNGQAISACKSRQRALAFFINPLEPPILSALIATYGVLAQKDTREFDQFGVNIEVQNQMDAQPCEAPQ